MSQPAAAPAVPDKLARTGANGFIGPRSLTPRYVGPVCKQHGITHPCWVCDEVQERDESLEAQRRAEVAAINERNLAIIVELEEEERKKAIQRVAASMTLRCHHNRVAMDCADCHLVSETYDKNIYRREINEALREADLRAYRFERKTGVGTENEATQFREKTFDDGSGIHDVVQMIDVAIWQATLHYGPR